MLSLSRLAPWVTALHCGAPPGFCGLRRHPQGLPLALAGLCCSSWPRVSGRAQRFLRGQLTHIVAWTWAFHVGLTVNLVWVWYRFQGTWL